MTATAAAPRTEPGTGLTAPAKVRAMITEGNARAAITPLLPHGITFERIQSELYFAAQKNPAIADCTPASIVQEVARAVAWDLPIGELVHLVPFNEKVSVAGQPDRWEKRVKALRDYKGDIELVIRSGAARDVDAKCVYQKETFEYEEGSEPRIRHVPILDEKSRGTMLGAYAIARLPKYGVKIVWMSLTEIDAIRQAKSKSWTKGPVEPWYAKKTVIHQVTKLIPKNPRLASVLAAFETEELDANELPAKENVPASAAAPAVDADYEIVEEPAKPEKNAPATEAQIARLLELAALPQVAHVKERIETKLQKGIKAAVAAAWIDVIETDLRSKGVSATATTSDEDDRLAL